MGTAALSQAGVRRMEARKDVPALMKALRYRRDEGVRSQAAEALAEVKNGRAVGALMGALNDASWSVRLVVTEALGAIGDPRAVKPLVQLLRNKNWLLRSQAAEALGNIWK